MEQELVSAVVITHNRKDLVLKAIDSVKKQTYPNLELIVVDDASDDGSRELLSEQSKEFGFRYIYIPSDESKGGNHARNVGIMASAGKYIAFLDDDDEWLPEKTELQVNFLNQNIEYALVHCGKLFEYDFSEIRKGDIEEIQEGDFRDKIWSKVAFTTSCLMVRKVFFEQVGMFDEELRFWQEYEFAIRACQNSKIGAIHQHLVLYRIIQKDRNRLTNKLAGWEDAVKYIEYKHSHLLSQLSEKQIKEHRLMVAYDGVLRCINGGDRKAKRKYLKKIFKIDPTIKNFLRYLLNRRYLSVLKREN